ncbi:MAG: ATP-dependent metallopeptidase FtsH/Yme1/Tma family protein, partial [Alphaproteobacteria bacterium]|nr:ATP-dependent metallopeptidase FtsH/Yme1/Tma family protein [Alphaproteobacteria bacterium]
MKLGKNAIIWIVIFMVMTALFSFADHSQLTLNSEQIAFSEFMNKVKEKQVLNVSISGSEVSGVTADGKRFVTYAPYSPSMVDTLLENNVRVDAKPKDTSSDTLWSIIISWFPMILLIGVWIF